MYKKGMRRAAALLAVCWLGLLFRAAAETPAEKLERLRAEQQAIEQQIDPEAFQRGKQHFRHSACTLRIGAGFTSVTAFIGQKKE